MFTYAAAELAERQFLLMRAQQTKVHRRIEMEAEMEMSKPGHMNNKSALLVTTLVEFSWKYVVSLIWMNYCFNIRQLIRTDKCITTICAHAYYKLYLNGQSVSVEFLLSTFPQNGTSES